MVTITCLAKISFIWWEMHVPLATRQTVWFIRAGGIVHSVREVQQYLDCHNPDRWMGRNETGSSGLRQHVDDVEVCTVPCSVTDHHTNNYQQIYLCNRPGIIM
jgi:hypothetical protein